MKLLPIKWVGGDDRCCCAALAPVAEPPSHVNRDTAGEFRVLIMLWSDAGWEAGE